MTALQPLLRAAFLVSLVVWSVLALYIITQHVVYGYRQRQLSRVRALLAPPGADARPRRPRRNLRARLGRLPRRVIERVAADTSTPLWMAQALSGYLLEKWGTRRLVRSASSHRGRVGKWRRIAALRILYHGGQNGLLPPLRRALESGEPDVAEAAISVLGKMWDFRAGHLLIEALTRRLYPPSRIASQIDRFPVPLADLLAPLLRDPEPITRFWGATLLSRYPATLESEDELVALGDDPDPRVRKAAILALGQMAAPAAASTAAKRLVDPVGFVRAHAARTLGQLGRGDLAGAIASLLADREWWVRAAAKEALAALGDASAPAVIALLEHPDRFARNGAAEVLQNIGYLDRLLADWAERSDGESRRLLARALVAGGLELVEPLLERAEPRLRRHARALVEELDLEPATSAR